MIATAAMQLTQFGRIPDAPLTWKVVKRQTQFGNIRSRAAACVEFAMGRETFKSLDVFIRNRKESIDRYGWRSSKAQIVRDM